MNEPDVYLDYYTRRTLSIIKVRNTFARLADELVRMGRQDSARAVLDRCLEILPNRQMPYDVFTIGLIESYYNAGAPERGKALATDYVDELKQELDYYFSFPERMQNQVSYQERVALQILQQITISIGDQDPDFTGQLEQDLTGYYQRYLEISGS